MKKAHFLVVAMATFVSCKQSTSSDTSTSTISNPLSIYDSKLHLSPDERYGVLFDSVQLSNIFTDSKTFVDCVPKTTTDSLMSAFDREKGKPDFNLQNFVNQYFIVPQNNESTYQTDMSKTASSHIKDLWTVLERKPDTANYGTKLPLPKSYVLSAGKFKDVYYWDSYFIMLGLQADGRIDLIENMVENFAQLINTEGYVPASNRTYSLSHSQPPFFSCMVQLLAEIKGETVYKKYLPQLEKEYSFWMEGALKEPDNTAFSKRRVVHIDKNTLNRYYDDSDKPRPEAFREDRDTAKKSGQDLNLMYRHLRAGAESGWDFSSRWFANAKDISTIHTTDILPTDLNALLYNLEMTIAKGKIIDKKLDEAALYDKKASKRREAMMRYCWNDELGMFFDFDFQRYRKTEVKTLATVYPLFFKMVTKRQADRVALAIQNYFLRPGGVVTTPNNTGYKWDAPYGYAPLQWMAIQGLRNYGHHDLANDIKKRWTELNINVYTRTGKMLEKYNVEDVSLENGGGEYPSQDGFGWTNGILQKLLKEK